MTRGLEGALGAEEVKFEEVGFLTLGGIFGRIIGGTKALGCNWEGGDAGVEGVARLW